VLKTSGKAQLEVDRAPIGGLERHSPSDIILEGARLSTAAIDRMIPTCPSAVAMAFVLSSST
jgi:hypothetical protein